MVKEECFVGWLYRIATINYYSEFGIWLGKILANGNRFAKFAKVSPTKVLRYTVFNKKI